MLFRMICGVLFHQKGKMLLIALTIALGASLATGMLNVVLGVEEKVNKELKNYGANITVKPKDSSLLSDIYEVGEGDSLNAAYLREDELGRLKTIFWAFNIVDFTPFLDAQVTLPDGSAARMTGTWFNHHLDLPTGESLDAGVVGMRSWWDVTEGRWLDEKDENAASEIMAGALLAQMMGVLISWLIFARKRDLAPLALSASSFAIRICSYCLRMTVPVMTLQTMMPAAMKMNRFLPCWIWCRS